MKKFLLLLLVVGGAGIGVYHHLTGRLPWVALSPEEVQVAELRETLALVRQQWKQAGRAGAFGVDTSTITDVPLRRLERLETDLAVLIPKLNTPEGLRQAEQLRMELAAFKRDMR